MHSDPWAVNTKGRTVPDSAQSIMAGASAPELIEAEWHAIPRAKCMAEGIRAARRLEDESGREFEMDPAQTEMLFEDVRAGAEAAVMLMTSFVPLATEVAARLCPKTTLEYSAARRACLQGLCVAALKFNPDLGCDFGPYAGYWMRRALAFTENAALLEALGGHTVSSKLRELRTTHERLTRTLGKEPTTDLLAVELGLSARLIIALSMEAKNREQGYDPLLNLDAELHNPLRDYLH